MAADLREAAVVTLDQQRPRAALTRILYAVLERFDVEAEVCVADDGTPHLAISLEGWASIMVTPEPDQPGRFGVVLSDDSGHLQISKAQTEAQALALAMRHI